MTDTLTAPQDLSQLVVALRSEERVVAHVGIFDINAYFRERRVRIESLETVFGEGGTFVNVLPRWDSGEVVYHPGPFVGEAVAIVVAETAAGAIDAAESVKIDYEELPAVTDARMAMTPEAPQVWQDCDQNMALTCEVGDRMATEQAFAGAAHVIEFDGIVNRVTGVPMEPRAVIGEYNVANDHYTLRTASGSGAVRTRDRLAEILGVKPSQCRVVFGDMGGNFGTRNAFYPEFALLPWAARKVGRPIKWTATRLECFLSDYQARDFVSRAQLALDEHGNFLALRGENTVNLGAQTLDYRIVPVALPGADGAGGLLGGSDNKALLAHNIQTSLKAWRRQTWVPAIAVIVQGKHQPLQWNIGKVHKYTGCMSMDQTAWLPMALM